VQGAISCSRTYLNLTKDIEGDESCAVDWFKSELLSASRAFFVHLSRNATPISPMLFVEPAFSFQIEKLSL